MGQLLASLVSGAPDTMEQQVRTLAPLVAEGTLAGIHLEGPFLSHARCGAHDPRVLTAPDPRLVERLVEAAGPNVVRQMTFAPELTGSLELVDHLVAHEILPAIGHTDGDAATVTTAIDRIVDRADRPALITHLFNGMPPMHHRFGGPVAAALSAAVRGDAYLELIADGVHVSADVVRMVFDVVGPHNIVLVSDAMAATGLGDGSYRLGELQVTVEDGVARLAQSAAIAGSTATVADCVRWCVDVVGLPEADVHTAASETPRLALGLDPVT